MPIDDDPEPWVLRIRRTAKAQSARTMRPVYDGLEFIWYPPDADGNQASVLYDPTVVEVTWDNMTDPTSGNL